MGPRWTLRAGRSFLELTGSDHGRPLRRGAAHGVEELDGSVSEVDIGVRRGRIRPYHVRHPRVLQAELSGHPRETIAFDGRPDFFGARPMWMRLAKAQRFEFQGQDTSQVCQPIARREQFSHDVPPMARGAGDDIRISSGWGSHMSVFLID